MSIFAEDKSNGLIRLSLGSCWSLRIVLRHNQSLKSMDNLRLFRIWGRPRSEIAAKLHENPYKVEGILITSKVKMRMKKMTNQWQR